jgi:hypothetical protein
MKAAVVKRNVLVAVALTILMVISHTMFSQVLPAASSSIAGHGVESYSIDSSEDYLNLESAIREVAGKVSEAYQKYPGLTYEPAYNGEEIIGFVIGGVKNAEEGNEIAYYLMQLEIMGNVVATVDEKFLPVASASSRVSRKDSRN